MRRTHLIAAAFALAPLASPAQFVTPGGQAGAAAQPAPGVQGQPAGALTTFAGVEFQALRLIRDPGSDALRLILRITETADAGRRAALIQPQAVLVDEMGNIYAADSVTGLPVCANNQPWDMDAANCAYYRKNDPVLLTPNLPTPVVINFRPAAEGFIADIAALAASASLKARVALFSQDFKDTTVSDVIINGIELPK